MDAEDIHQRDVARLLCELDDNINAIRTQFSDDPSKQQQMREDIRKIIESTDRDLRLKEQAIVKSRLAKSNTIPVSFTPPGRNNQPLYSPRVNNATDTPRKEPTQEYQIPSTATPHTKPSPRPSTQISKVESKTSICKVTRTNQRSPVRSKSRFSDIDTYDTFNTPQTTRYQSSKLQKKVKIADSEFITSRVFRSDFNPPIKSKSIFTGNGMFTPLSSKADLEGTMSKKLGDTVQFQSPISSNGELDESQGMKRLSKERSTVLTSRVDFDGTRSNVFKPNRTAKNAIERMQINTSPVPSPQKHKKRAQTSTSKKRKRIIPDYVPQLPQVDKHDPFAPPPPIPDDAYDKYGLQQLNESKLVPDEELPQHMRGLVTVVPFYYDDLLLRAGEDKQHWKLDIQKHEMVQSTSYETEMKKVEQHNRTIKKKLEQTKKSKPFLVFINGVPNSNTPEYINFRRIYTTLWEQIGIIFDMLRKICEEFGLVEQKVDCAFILELTRFDPDEISKERLYRCFIPPLKESRRATKVGFGFYGPSAENKAATLIQSIWRGFHARRLVRQIKRTHQAACTIQREFRVSMLSRGFHKVILEERNKKYIRYEGIQVEPTMYQPAAKHIMVHLVGSAEGVEIGCVRDLVNPNMILVLFFHQSLSQQMQDLFIKYTPNKQDLHLYVSSMRLPDDLAVEEILASDMKSLHRIRALHTQVPVMLIPTRIHPAIVDISLKLNAIILSPSTNRRSIYESHDSVRRILKSASAPLFEASSEVFDKESICKELSGMIVMKLSASQWVLRKNDGQIAWINTGDINLLEQIKFHAGILTESDLEDPSFLKLLQQSIMNDFNSILNVSLKTPSDQFLRDFSIRGGIIEEGPTQVKSQPNVAIFIPPVGHPSISGTWETLFVSAYEPFAQIFPAFTVNRDKLKKMSLKIAAECSSKRLIGYHVIKYFYSARTLVKAMGESRTKMKLTAQNIEISKDSEIAPLRFAETLLNMTFDEESMSLGPSTYTYVQRRVDFPEEIELEDLKVKCLSLMIPIDERVFFVPYINDNSKYSMLITEDSVEKLIMLVYRVLVSLSDRVFDLTDEPFAPLYAYCTAIEFLKQQFDNTKELSTTVLTSIIKARDIRHSRERTFSFSYSAENQS